MKNLKTNFTSKNHNCHSDKKGFFKKNRLASVLPISIGLLLFSMAGSSFAYQTPSSSDQSISSNKKQALENQVKTSSDQAFKKLQENLLKENTKNLVDPDNNKTIQSNDKKTDDQNLEEKLNKGLDVENAYDDLTQNTSANQDTLLKRMAQSQAQLSVLDMKSKIEETKMKIKMSRLKFLEQKQKYKSEQKKNEEASDAKSSGKNIASFQNSNGSPIDKTAFNMQTLTTSLGVNMPKVESIYSFGGRYNADISIGENKSTVHKGDVLLNGDKVLSISPMGVNIMHNHKKVLLHLGGNYLPTPPTEETAKK